MKRDSFNRIENDLLIINALSFVLVLTIVFVPDSQLRIVLGIPFVLFFPGYTFLSALFPGKKDLGIIERLALSVGLSLSMVPLVGVVLNYTSWGIMLYPLVTSLFVLTLLFSFVTSYRRSKLLAEQKPRFAFPQMPQWNTIHSTNKLFAAGLLVVIFLVGGFAVYLASAPKIGERFTEFYVLGSNGTLSDYPVNLTLGKTGVLTLGIKNHEYTNMTYRIVVSLNNQTIGEIDNIQLSHEACWNQTFTFTPETTGEKLKLEFHLYNPDETQVYRNLQLLVNVRPPE